LFIITIIIIIIIIITNTHKKLFAGIKMQPEKKLFAQTTTQKIVCLENIFIPPPPKK